MTAAKRGAARATEGMRARLIESKPRVALFPLSVLVDVGLAMAGGCEAEGYAPGDWKDLGDVTLDEAREGHVSAIMRHLGAWQDGEYRDPKTCAPHWAHVIARAGMIGWLETRARVSPDA